MIPPYQNNALREVTVGRARDCDITLDMRCTYASNHHAVIYFDGHMLMYRDTSTNGTLINNINVKGRAVPIHPGDTIMIGAHYPLNWAQVMAYFPQVSHGTMINSAPSPNNLASTITQQGIPERELSKWSWGAFSLYPLWGFFNGCWWGILISIFCWWLSPIPNIIFGINGTRWAWRNRNWESFEAFQHTQKTWNTVGLILFCINLLWIPFVIIILASM